MERLLKNHFIQFLISGVLLLGVLFIIFTPSIGLFKKLSNFSVHIMMGYLLIGMFFFLYDQKRLVIASLIGCGVLCLYLKSASNQNMRLAIENAEPKLSIALVDLSSADDGYQRTIEHIRGVEADVISFQELTPNWVDILRDSLGSQYPFQHMMVRLDPFGMGVFSKFPFQKIDTFYYKQIPNLLTSVDIKHSTPFHLIHSISEAPVNDKAYAEIRSHFQEITSYSASLFGEIITVGNYHLPSWASEMLEFKFNARLKDSRRDGLPRSPGGAVSFFGVPVDHIFFSEQLECTEFRVIANDNASHLGIVGTYQLRFNQIAQ